MKFALSNTIITLIIFSVPIILKGQTVQESANESSGLANPIKIELNNKYFLECTVDKKGKLMVKKVDEVIYPEKTIIADFQYHKVFKSNLEIKNPFNKKLKYRAFIYYPSLKEWKETSIITVYPKISSREMWQPKIPELMLTEFELVD